MSRFSGGDVYVLDTRNYDHIDLGEPRQSTESMSRDMTTLSSCRSALKQLKEGYIQSSFVLVVLFLLFLFLNDI